MDYKTEILPISKLHPNKGQVKGLPKNPRFVRDDKFNKLKQSLTDDPEFMQLREIVAYDNNGELVIIGGNMRYRALKDLGIKEAPVKVLPSDTPLQKLRAFTIKDNAGFGEWDWDDLANEWDTEQLNGWGVDIPVKGFGEYDGMTDEEIIAAKKREFEERIAAGEMREEDEEYQEFLEKFQAKKTTDDCYTPALVYDAVADWVCSEYGVQKKDFVRPFYPNGDYQRENYPKGCVVVDNPPFSILSEIIKFYISKNVRFFLFAPALTLFSSASQHCTSVCVGVGVTYENNAVVSTSFVTNLGDKNIRARTAPALHKAISIADEKVRAEMRRELPKYNYPSEIITSTRLSYLSKYGIDFNVSASESESISQLDAQKEMGKSIFGKGYLISEAKAAEAKAAEAKAAEAKAAEAKAAEAKGSRSKGSRSKRCSLATIRPRESNS